VGRFPCDEIFRDTFCYSYTVEPLLDSNNEAAMIIWVLQRSRKKKMKHYILGSYMVLAFVPETH